MSRKLKIYQQIFTESGCYRDGETSRFRGVQVHSTGSDNAYLKRYVQPDDGLLGVNAYGNSHNRPDGDVCANAYIGKLQDGTVAVYQTLPWDMRCWISGKGDCGNANKVGFIGFEICEDDLTNEAYFEAVMTAAVNLTAHLCWLMGTKPENVIELEIDGTEDDKKASCWKIPDGDVLAVMDHSELARLGLASGHADITHWLRRYGKRMTDFRKAVAEAMEEGVEVEYIEAGAIPEEDFIEMDKQMEIYSANGGYVNLRESPNVKSASLERLYPGDVVRVTAMTGTWSKAETVDHAGYVMTEYLKEIPQKMSDAVSIPRELARQMYDALGKALK